MRSLRMTGKMTYEQLQQQINKQLPTSNVVLGQTRCPKVKSDRVAIALYFKRTQTSNAQPNLTLTHFYFHNQIFLLRKS